MSAKLEKIAAERERARKKRDEWDAKVKELDRKYREEENSEIHDMVHAANLTPEQLAEIIRLANAGNVNPENLQRMNGTEE
ncbi:MAG: DUF4315 family protein [Oliverpabstia sp.]|uniref:DUF4315 family protein n=1 Tax=Oribacterium sp. HCP3S3_B9 TaxID=3438946 RepID=UPI003F09336C